MFESGSEITVEALGRNQDRYIRCGLASESAFNIWDLYRCHSQDLRFGSGSRGGYTIGIGSRRGLD